MVSGALEDILMSVLETVVKLDLEHGLRIRLLSNVEFQVTKKLDMAVHAFNPFFLRKKQEDL